ncbi:hypothetical protein F4821DRAFT_273381 [Hypoxylon rubiginosum]|uniref:Uncharacterized protein n=1 Tax=Hypoxylon rubiginosum TaxID=110542 RepID=A0ACC0CKU3_9PEZI|nr:hypothetical protein F4821DRAFT_273381 [Hypoxylon rubiginosum]
MSYSFLTAQDIENWSAKPIAHAFNQCRNEFERFFLWGQGLSVIDGDLDEALARSKEVRFRVLSLLLRLGTVVLEGLSRNPGPPSQLLTEQCENLHSLLDTTEVILQEMEPNESVRPTTPSGSDTSEVETVDIVAEMSIYIDCLLDLAPVLDNPAVDIDVDDSDEPPTRIRESFVVSSDEALIYCRKIRDRFKFLPKYLVERLAEANVVRAAALRKLRSRHFKPAAPVSDDITESLFSTKDHRFTETTKSTTQSPSVFSLFLPFKKRQSVKDYMPDNDNESEATFASFSTAQSSTTLGRPRVPPMPEVQRGRFMCPVCSNNVIDVKSRKDWK